MSKSRVVERAVTLAGILALTAATSVLAKEDPDVVVEKDGDRKVTLEKQTPDDDAPVVSTQGRTLDLMLMIWTLKTTSDETK